MSFSGGPDWQSLLENVHERKLRFRAVWNHYKQSYRYIPNTFDKKDEDVINGISENRDPDNLPKWRTFKFAHRPVYNPTPGHEGGLLYNEAE